MTDIQKQLLAILVLDLGHDHEPSYGHTPIRHQWAWTLATKDVDPAEVAKEVRAMIDGNDGYTFASYYERQRKVFERQWGTPSNG